jgi:hypothetical protein
MCNTAPRNSRFHHTSEPAHQLGPTVYIGPRKLFGRWGILDLASWDAGTRTNLFRRISYQVGDVHARRICVLLSVYSRVFRLKRALTDRVPEGG